MTEKSSNESEKNERLVALDTGIGQMAFGAEEMLTEEQAALKREALALFKDAYEAQMRGDLDEAASLYQSSIEAYPTAEAHTFLGWTYSFMGRTDDAIEECHLAIEVDPDFGNPYNDIGAYLIEKGEYYSAVEWLEKAKDARRYEAYFYPHFNLGRVYEALRRPMDAIREYKAAVDLNPNYELALRAMRKLQSTFN
ncbi:MAG TPA: tetratricopeptide repeat protein [Blastocatellia bacterium]|jgi:tetratricopeptide (TPR) repeat protein|nr:tetratricopeptide repeat protein [Blastocatellia bacterium]